MAGVCYTVIGIFRLYYELLRVGFYPLFHLY